MGAVDALCRGRLFSVLFSLKAVSSNIQKRQYTNEYAGTHVSKKLTNTNTHKSLIQLNATKPFLITNNALLQVSNEFKAQCVKYQNIIYY